jgi:DNA invertase Pin-like site-specific DNA recombinase
MMIGVLGSLAEYERELTKERTALKRQVSRANGTKFGRPKKVSETKHIATAKRMKNDGHTADAFDTAAQTAADALRTIPVLRAVTSD